MAFLFYKLGNHLFRWCYPVYRPVYEIFKATSDRNERQLLRACIQPGMTVVDLGANIGVYSVFLSSLVGPQGQVFSFEPSPENFARLSAATRSHGNIVKIAAAVGAESKELALYLSDSLNVDHRTYPTGGEDRQAVPIRGVALDDYFPAGTQVDFIKADIQGFELAALEGAKRVLADSPNIKLLLEFSPYLLTASGNAPQALLDFLKERGFSICKVGERGELEELQDGDFAVAETIYCNIFATRHP